MANLKFIERNEDTAKSLDALGRLPDGEYEEWFGGWDVFPRLDSLKRAISRNGNCVYARYDGVPEEVTVTDGATVGFGGSEDPRNPNWHTHQEQVCADKSNIGVGDMVSFTVRNNGKAVKLKGKVVEKEYEGKWDKGGSSAVGRPTCSFTIRLAPKTIENAIAKLEGVSEASDLHTYCLDIWTVLTKDMGKSAEDADRLIDTNPTMIYDCWDDGVGPVVAARRVADESKSAKSESALNRITMKEVRKVLDKLQKDGHLDKALREVTSLCTYAGNHIANTDPDVTDNKLNAPERKIVARAVLAHIASQFGYQPEDLR